MERYKDMTVRKKCDLKMIRNLVFFVLLIIFTFWFIFKDQNIGEIIETIKSVNIIYVFLGILCMFMYYLTEAYNIRSILVALGEKKISMLKALKFTFIGFLFSAITPAATGGQPVEVYYMTKENIKTANGTMTMMLELCGYQISAILMSLICMIFYGHTLENGIIWFYILGLTLNSFALSFMLIGIFSKKATKKLVNLFVKILRKIQVKNVDKKAEKIEEGLNQYNESAVFIKKHKTEFVKAVLRVFVQIAFYYMIPFCTYKAFGLSGYSFIHIFAMQAIFYTTVSSIPLPGSIGVSETLFLKIFGSMFTTKYISGAMLINRFASFYLYILVSATIVIVNAVKTKNIVGEIDKSVKEIEGKISIKKPIEVNA